LGRQDRKEGGGVDKRKRGKEREREGKTPIPRAKASIPLEMRVLIPRAKGLKGLAYKQSRAPAFL
jgi:hypothetical protein